MLECAIRIGCPAVLRSDGRTVTSKPKQKNLASIGSHIFFSVVLLPNAHSVQGYAINANAISGSKVNNIKLKAVNTFLTDMI